MESTTNLEQLRDRARKLGVEVDNRWGAERLQQEIDSKKADGRESEYPDPDGALNDKGDLVNVGSTADPVYQRKE